MYTFGSVHNMQNALIKYVYTPVRGTRVIFSYVYVHYYVSTIQYIYILMRFVLMKKDLEDSDIT